MASQRDGWVRRKMSGYIERWVAKYRGGRLSRDGWFFSEMGGSVERKVAKYRDGWISRETGCSVERWVAQ
jgi:hypothetical protein